MMSHSWFKTVVCIRHSDPIFTNKITYVSFEGTPRPLQIFCWVYTSAPFGCRPAGESSDRFDERGLRGLGKRWSTVERSKRGRR